MPHRHPFRHHAYRHLAQGVGRREAIGDQQLRHKSTTIAISASRLAASAHSPGTSPLVAIQTPASSSQSASTR